MATYNQGYGGKNDEFDFDPIQDFASPQDYQ